MKKSKSVPLVLAVLAATFWIAKPSRTQADPTPTPAPTTDPAPVDWIGPNLNLAKFVDAMPVPPRITLPESARGLGGNKPYPMEATQFAHQFHRDLPPAQVWGYNRSFPGPTLEAQSKEGVRVQWINHLPAQPLLQVTSAMSSTQHLPPVRTVVHLHGASVPEVGFSDRHQNADGWPDSWNVPGDSQLAVYPNTQDAAGLWYHDHTTGITSENVYSGLAGTYLIRDAYEKSLNLPSGNYEVPLVIQGRSFRADGSMYYPPRVATEFYGNVTVVNGKIWPYFNVEPRKYRFRVLNASNARTYSLKLLASDQAGPPINQIGSDGGFLEETVVLNNPADPASHRLVLAPGERADVIVDFSGSAGKTLLLHNDSKTDSDDIEATIPEVMQFRVAGQAKGADTSEIPTRMRAIAHMKESEAKRSRTVVFSETDYPDGSQMLLLNGLHWEDPVVEKPLVNTVEVWKLLNATEDQHPFHIHLVQFQVLSRQPFDPEKYKDGGQLVFTGDPIAPEPGETGWKDTVRAWPGHVTKVIMRFGPYAGHFVYHCHILEHEDMDMMRPFEVVTQEALTDPEVPAVSGWARPFDLLRQMFRVEPKSK